MKKNMQGFTLIELMIVIAIIAILVAIALPAYQNYTIRAKNSECVSIAASPKLAISDFIQSEGVFPASGATGWTAVGYAPAATTMCQAATLAGSGAFSIQNDTAGTGGGSVTFTFTPTTSAAATQWRCTSSGNSAHVPASCR